MGMLGYDHYKTYEVQSRRYQNMKRVFKIPRLKWLISIAIVITALTIFFIDASLQAENHELPRVWATSQLDKPEGILQSAARMQQGETQAPLRSQGLTNFEVWQTNNEIIIGLQFDESIELPSNQLVAVLRDGMGQPWNMTDISLNNMKAANSSQVWLTLSFDEGVIHSRNEDSAIEVGFVTGDAFVVSGSDHQLSAAEVEESGPLTPLYQLATIKLSGQ